MAALLKNAMKKLFSAIRQGDAATVCALLDKKPELLACTAKAPPKKDAGQSPPAGGDQEQ